MITVKPIFRWVDIVEINNVQTLNSFPVSDQFIKTDEQTKEEYYDFDELKEVVAKQYDVLPSDVKSYMAGDIDPNDDISTETCGLYINGVSEWKLLDDVKHTTKEQQKADFIQHKSL